MKKLRMRSSKNLQKKDTVPLPSDERISSLCKILSENAKNEETKRRYAKVKHILTFIGVAGVVGLSVFVSPSAAMLVKPILDKKRKEEKDQWKDHNQYFLKRSLRRLHEEKFVEIKEHDGKQVVILTKSGKHRILKYALDDLKIPIPSHWDGNWRLVIYDVDERRKRLRDVFRDTLRSLGFFKLQESVWIYPYRCEEQITFLREYYGVGNEVLYVVATTLEDDTPFRTYFGLN